MALRRAALILCTALAGAGASSADPSTPLAGFGDFSGNQTQIAFDNLGLFNGDDVASVEGVALSLSTGDAAKYYEDFFARESGLGDVGSIANFWGFVRPYPDLSIALPGPMHRVGFEMRVNAADQVSVMLLSGGAMVDQVVVPSRGSDALYFYGFENAVPFDAVQVDVIDQASGAFTLDNLAFENLGGPEPPPDDPGEPEVPVLACDGFDSFPPMRQGHSHHHLPLRALMAKLLDADGHPMTAQDMTAPPMLRVMYMPEAGGSAVDVTDAVTLSIPDFRYAGGRVKSWFVWMLPWEMRRDGTYLATMESGDPAAYTLDPTCADWTLIERNPRRHDKGRGHDRHRGH
jgi:hypothetical protein